MADKVAGRMAPDAIKMALVHRVRHGEAQEVHEVEVTRFETMASCLLVGHANGAMFDPWHGPGQRSRCPALVPPPRRPCARIRCPPRRRPRRTRARCRG